MYDFGPLNLGAVFRFCKKLEQLQKGAGSKRSQICHYSDSGPEKLANAVLLMGAFEMIILRKSAGEAWRPFSSLNLKPFRDPGMDICTHKCTVLHCLQGLEKAIGLNWFSYSRFDLKLYEKHSTVQEGDYNWIIPGKMLAFSSPSSRSTFRAYSPEKYGDEFKSMGISAVVRLNEPLYDSSVFTRRGIKFFDLFFPDGSCPTVSIVNKFLQIAEENGPIAVHCKAGLGRTGTLIGCFAIKKYGFTAEEFIGWARLCRPGSVIGPQQGFLIDYARRNGNISGFTGRSYEDGQAERLIRAKEMHVQRNGGFSRGHTPEIRSDSFVKSARYPSSDFDAMKSCDSIRERNGFKSFLQAETDFYSKQNELGHRYDVGKFKVDLGNQKSIRENMQTVMTRNTQNNSVREYQQIRPSRDVYSKQIEKQFKDYQIDMHNGERSNDRRVKSFRDDNEDRPRSTMSYFNNHREESSYSSKMENPRIYRDNLRTSNYRDYTPEIPYTNSRSVSKMNTGFREMMKYPYESYSKTPGESIYSREIQGGQRPNTPYRTPYASICAPRSEMSPALLQN